MTKEINFLDPPNGHSVILYGLPLLMDYVRNKKRNSNNTRNAVTKWDNFRINTT